MLTVAFNVDGVERVLDLRLNTDLIPVGYQQLHQHRGTYKVHTPSKVVSTVWASSIRIRVLTAFPQTTLALIDIERASVILSDTSTDQGKPRGYIQLNPMFGHSLATRHVSERYTKNGIIAV